MSATALLVSSDATLIEKVEEIVSAIGGLALKVLDGMDEVLDELEGGRAALVLAHVRQEGDGDEVSCLLQEMVATGTAVATVVISDRHRAEQSLALLRQGIADYLSRPLDLHRLAYMIDKLTVRARYVPREPVPAREPVAVEKVGAHGTFLYPPGGSMGLLMDQVRTVAPQDTSVLLSGETGTGKTCLARVIHELSARRGAPFMVINCGSLAANLIESELFGHIKGAFTGADRDRVGKFEAVGAGTLLLDEVDALPLSLQAKLLRVVEERVFEPLGSNKSLPAKARLIVASNRVLDEEMLAGRFRSDLYYRLNVVAFYLPPLRERKEIIPALVNNFIAEFASRAHRPARGLSAKAVRAFEQYDWPGNIRELRNAIERAVALCPGPEICLADLPEAIGAAEDFAEASQPRSPQVIDITSPSGTLGEAKEGAETARILGALHRHRNNRLRAARELGISRMTLYKKLHKYGLVSRCDNTGTG